MMAKLHSTFLTFFNSEPICSDEDDEYDEEDEDDFHAFGQLSIFQTEKNFGK